MSSRKRRGAGDTEHRQLLRANLCFSNILFSFKAGANSIHEMMCESKRAGQSATSGQADLYPVSSSPSLGPVLVPRPFRIWRSTLSPPAGEQSLEKVQINSVPLGNICQQAEEALPGQGTLPRTPLIQWYLQLDTLPVDKVQPAITSLKCS